MDIAPLKGHAKRRCNYTWKKNELIEKYSFIMKSLVIQKQNILKLTAFTEKLIDWNLALLPDNHYGKIRTANKY